MLLARAVRLPSLLLVFCQVKQERSYAYSRTSFVSQSGRRRLTILRFCETFCFYATVAPKCFCGSLLQIWLLCDQATGVEYFKWFVWVYFDVGRVNIFLR